MKRNQWLLWLWLIIVVGFLASCKSKTQSQEAALPKNQPDGDQQGKPANPPEITKPQASEKGSPHPGYVTQSIAFTKKVSQLTKDNLTDCGKAAEEVEKYVNEHKADLQTLFRTFKEESEKLSPDAKSKLAQQMLTLAGPEVFQTQMDFAQKCPVQDAKLLELLRALQPKP